MQIDVEINEIEDEKDTDYERDRDDKDRGDRHGYVGDGVDRSEMEVKGEGKLSEMEMGLIEIEIIDTCGDDRKMWS